jgi:hypothetical protein
MSIDLEDLSPEQRAIYEKILEKESEQLADVPLEERTIEPQHPQDARRELDGMYQRLVEAAQAHGGKRETSAEIGTPTSRHGIALDAVLSELTRTAKRYPELEPFIRRAMEIAREGLIGASNGTGNRIELPE